jgi:hypothetical protein
MTRIQKVSTRANHWRPGETFFLARRRFSHATRSLPTEESNAGICLSIATFYAGLYYEAGCYRYCRDCDSPSFAV